MPVPPMARSPAAPQRVLSRIWPILRAAPALRHSARRSFGQEPQRFSPPDRWHVNEFPPFFEGLAASGWHTASLTMRLLVTGGLRLAGELIGTGGTLSWPKPTRPGDALRVETEVVEVRPSRSRADRGMATFRCSTLNVGHEVVQLFMGTLLVWRRKTP